MRVIGSFAFDEIKMKSVVIPDKVIDIRRYSFQSAGLKELIIGESVIGIGELAFGGCPLETITSLNPNPPSMIMRPLMQEFILVPNFSFQQPVSKNIPWHTIGINLLSLGR